ncbi:integrase core domain-containing protein [Nitrobacter sp. TKz-YC02]|uniref:integrase core domain-containing protein n=1 Tax=Nitrobacter sp. TKz-YC02 TaxID=3398704 RepID=UPI003CEFDA17
MAGNKSRPDPRSRWRIRRSIPASGSVHRHSRSPWQNAYVERLIGSIRRECLDHVVVFGERHLRHVLLSYMTYYNDARTHLSLNKDAPISRSVETAGRIPYRPILGGLHHQYVRI